MTGAEGAAPPEVAKQVRDSDLCGSWVLFPCRNAELEGQWGLFKEPLVVIDIPTLGSSITRGEVLIFQWHPLFCSLRKHTRPCYLAMFGRPNEAQGCSGPERGVFLPSSLLLYLPGGKRKAFWGGLAQFGSKPLLLERLQRRGK